MAYSYAYEGYKPFIEEVSSRLDEAGFVRVDKSIEAGFVITYYTSQTALEDAYFGEEGFIQTAPSGTVFVDLSASTPNFAREINALSVVNDLVFIEAPLAVKDQTQSSAFAGKGNLICFVSGEENDMEQVLPLLHVLAETVQVTEGVGSAQLARASYTLQTVAQAVAHIEAGALCRAVFSSATGLHKESSYQLDTLFPQNLPLCKALHDKRFEGSFTVELCMAELSAALMTADDVDVILPQAEAAMHMLELLAIIGGADKTPTALSLVYGEEKECALHGLDWTRAEQAYHEHDSEDFSDYEDRRSGAGYDGYGGFDYSAN